MSLEAVSRPLETGVETACNYVQGVGFLERRAMADPPLWGFLEEAFPRRWWRSWEAVFTWSMFEPEIVPPL